MVAVVEVEVSGIALGVYRGERRCFHGGPGFESQVSEPAKEKAAVENRGIKQLHSATRNRAHNSGEFYYRRRRTFCETKAELNSVKINSESSRVMLAPPPFRCLVSP